MRAQLLLVELPYSIEHFRDELEGLITALPEGSAKVIYTDRVVGIAMPHTSIPEVMAIRLRKYMSAFSSWRIVGLNGELVSKDGSMDPFRHWMNKNLRIQPAPKRDKPKDVALPKRRQIGLKGTI